MWHEEGARRCLQCRLRLRQRKLRSQPGWNVEDMLFSRLFHLSGLQCQWDRMHEEEHRGNRSWLWHHCRQLPKRYLQQQRRLRGNHWGSVRCRPVVFGGRRDRCLCVQFKRPMRAGWSDELCVRRLQLGGNRLLHRKGPWHILLARQRMQQRVLRRGRLLQSRLHRSVRTVLGGDPGPVYLQDGHGLQYRHRLHGCRGLLRILRRLP